MQLESGSLIFQLEIGNTHELQDLDHIAVGLINKHKWTAYVKLSDICLYNGIDISKLIHKVRFGLHPAFGFEVVDIEAKSGLPFQFSLTRDSHESFNMFITIWWNKKSGIRPERIQIKHEMVFEGAGAKRIQNIKMLRRYCVKEIWAKTV